MTSPGGYHRHELTEKEGQALLTLGECLTEIPAEAETPGEPELLSPPTAQTLSGSVTPDPQARPPHSQRLSLQGGVGGSSCNWEGLEPWAALAAHRVPPLIPPQTRPGASTTRKGRVSGPSP